VGEATGAGGKKRAISAGVTGDSRIFRPSLRLRRLSSSSLEKERYSRSVHVCGSLSRSVAMKNTAPAERKRTSLIGQEGISLTTLSYLLKKT